MTSLHDDIALARRRKRSALQARAEGDHIAACALLEDAIAELQVARRARGELADLYGSLGGTLRDAGELPGGRGLRRGL